MTLSSLIRKRDTVGIATAIPAISATQPKGEAATVARIATVAVANPEKEKTAPPAKVGAGDTATASRWWLIHYPDRDPVEMSCSPPATCVEIMASYPAASAAEPFEPIPRKPDASMTTPEERAVRAWLARIEESDPAIIVNVLTVCREDADARGYYLRRAQHG